MKLKMLLYKYTFNPNGFKIYFVTFPNEATEYIISKGVFFSMNSNFHLELYIIILLLADHISKFLVNFPKIK
jgi:hypothetical protein